MAGSEQEHQHEAFIRCAAGLMDDEPYWMMFRSSKRNYEGSRNAIALRRERVISSKPATAHESFDSDSWAGQNLFEEYPQLGKSGEEKFNFVVGTAAVRLRKNPVAIWGPDNISVEVRVTPNGLVARARRGTDQFAEGMEEGIASSATDVTLSHRITNNLLLPLRLPVGPGGNAASFRITMNRNNRYEIGATL